MNGKLIVGASLVALGWIAFAGTGATQGWVNHRIAESETNTQIVVDGKIHSASNSIMADTQRRIDEHLSTNGVTGAWVMEKIGESQTNTLTRVSTNLNDQLLHDIDEGVIKARAVLSDPSNTNAVNEARTIMLEATFKTAEFILKYGSIL